MIQGLVRGDRVAILTSGGDSPGMNATLRAAARVGAELGLVMLGVEDGYVGLLEGRLTPLDIRACDEAARRGGTLLGTARSKVFPTPEGQAKVRKTIADAALRGVIVVGGNGSLTGAHCLATIETPRGPLLVGGVPASIDNDLACTSMSVGVDTAMNTIVEACDRILDTATSHKRTFIVEVMGRECGYLAMTAGIAAAADAVLVPEQGKTEGQLVEQLLATIRRSYGLDREARTAKRHVLVLKAEGVHTDSARLKALVDAALGKELPDVDTRVTILGHVVRGGTPTAFDRLLGARLTNAVLRAMAEGQTDVMAGWIGPGTPQTPCPWDPYVVLTPLGDVLDHTARMMHGESEIARWRKRIFHEVEDLLRQ